MVCLLSEADECWWLKPSGGGIAEPRTAHQRGWHEKELRTPSARSQPCQGDLSPVPTCMVNLQEPLTLMRGRPRRESWWGDPQPQSPPSPMLWLLLLLGRPRQPHTPHFMEEEWRLQQHKPGCCSCRQASCAPPVCLGADPLRVTITPSLTPTRLTRGVYFILVELIRWLQPLISSSAMLQV